jgi:transcription initiation factor TFIIIB Brf1 subunit/transcription initiation factor TFIIB
MHACKKAKVARSAKEIAEMCDLDVSVVNNASKIFYKIIEDDTEETICPDDLIIRFCNCLGIDKNTEKALGRRVRELCHEFKNSHELIGKTPSAITSAFVYKALSESNSNINKKFICQQHKISVVTLNKILKIIS